MQKSQRWLVRKGSLGNLLFKTVVPNLFGNRGQFQFMKDNFSTDWDVVGMIQVHYVYCALYFYYYYISSTSDHQALDPRGWGPLV